MALQLYNYIAPVQLEEQLLKNYLLLKFPSRKSSKNGPKSKLEYYKSGYAVVTTTIRLRFDGRSTAY